MMTNKFVSWLEAVGKDFQKGLSFLLPWAAGAGEVAVSAFAPALGPMFNSTVSAVVLAEQKYAVLKQQTGSGPSKLKDVVTLMGPVIAQGLADAGRANDAPAVQTYVNSVVAVLNAAPAASSTP